VLPVTLLVLLFLKQTIGVKSKPEMMTGVLVSGARQNPAFKEGGVLLFYKKLFFQKMPA
jgi:hypothetical protein